MWPYDEEEPEDVLPAPAPIPTTTPDLPPPNPVNFQYTGFPEDQALKIKNSLSILEPSERDILSEFRMSLEDPTPPNISILYDKEKAAKMNPPGSKDVTRAFTIPGEPNRIYLADPFFWWGDDDRAVTLGHEMMHALGMRHKGYHRSQDWMTDAQMSAEFSRSVKKILDEAKKRKKKDKGWGK